MTWAEFKAEVEQLGVKDEDEVWYIDTHPFPGGFEARRKDGEENLGWAIS